MSHVRLIVSIVVGVVLIVVLWSAFYTVGQSQQALVLRFGRVIRQNEAPGLHVKIPFVDWVRYYDGRLLTLDADPQTVLTQDKKQLVVDAFIKWRIVDAGKFFGATGGNDRNAQTLLLQAVNGGLRDAFGKLDAAQAVAGDRRKIMEGIVLAADEQAREYGIEVVDARLQRLSLPADAVEDLYQHMSAENARTAKELRAQGAEAAEKIRADADRQRQVLLAQAYRDAQRIRGEGDARAAAIYAQAYKRDPEFYAFYRSLEAYKESFKNKSNVLVLDPSLDFFKYFRKPR